VSPTAPFLAPERDPTFKRGRYKPSGGTNDYTVPGVPIFQMNSLHTLVASTDYYCGFFCDTPLICDQMAIEVTTLAAGANARLGIYPADTDMQPAAGAAPLTDSGNISVASTGVKTWTPAAPLYLPRGRYLMVITSDGAPVIRAATAAWLNSTINTALGTTPLDVRCQVARAYAAFPTPGTPWTSFAATIANNISTFIFLRISSP